MKAKIAAVCTPLLLCLLCPAHLSLIASVLGLGAVASHDHKENLPLYLGLGVLISVAILLADRYWHRRNHKHCSHKH